MVQATTCTRRNATATAKSQPISFWGLDLLVNPVRAVLFVTTMLVSGILFEFVCEQVLVLA